jgi:hypothetical protein
LSKKIRFGGAKVSKNLFPIGFRDNPSIYPEKFWFIKSAPFILFAKDSVSAFHRFIKLPFSML